MGRVFVAGSINMDVVVTAGRHPRVGETVLGNDVMYFPGGKGANQAVAAARLGAPTTLIGRIGADAFGRDLKAFLDTQGIDMGLVRQTSEAHSGTAVITVANADNTIVVVPGANAWVSAADVAKVTFSPDDVAVSQFEILPASVAAFFERARTAGATTLLNPAPVVEFGRELLDLVDILVLNETELSLLSSTELDLGDDHARIIEASRSLQGDTGRIVCITLGSRGVLALVDNQPIIIQGHTVEAVDTTGAGDCFVGALAARLAMKQPIADALNYANVAASICVQRLGAASSMPTAAELSVVLDEMSGRTTT